MYKRIIFTDLGHACYDALYQILELEFFHNGQVWRFYDVPEQIWYEWRKAERKLSYFHSHISGTYSARKIGITMNRLL